MTFKEKIDKIIQTNPYMIGSVYGLEKFCGIGTSALKRYYNADEESSVKIFKKIIKALRIPRSWWDNPIGDPFSDPFQIYKDLSYRIEELELENYRIRKENESLAARIEKLKGLNVRKTIKRATVKR